MYPHFARSSIASRHCILTPNPVANEKTLFGRFFFRLKKGRFYQIKTHLLVKGLSHQRHHHEIEVFFLSAIYDLREMRGSGVSRLGEHSKNCDLERVDQTKKSRYKPPSSTSSVFECRVSFLVSLRKPSTCRLFDEL